MANQNPTGNRYDSLNQPMKKGRKRSVFGPLAKENNLSLDDVRKIYKNILTAKSVADLDGIKAKYPSLLAEMTVDMLKQDRAGRLTGRKFKVRTSEGEREIDERIKSYETIQYMLDRIFGTPAKADISIINQIDISIGEPPPLEDWYPD